MTRLAKSLSRDFLWLLRLGYDCNSKQRQQTGLIRNQLSSLHTPLPVMCITWPVVENSEIYDGRRRVFVEWKNQILSLRLN